MSGDSNDSSSSYLAICSGGAMRLAKVLPYLGPYGACAAKVIEYSTKFLPAAYKLYTGQTSTYEVMSSNIGEVCTALYYEAFKYLGLDAAAEIGKNVAHNVCEVNSGNTTYSECAYNVFSSTIGTVLCDKLPGCVNEYLANFMDESSNSIV